MSTDRELRLLVESLLQQISYQNTHLSVVAEKLATGTMNHVLYSGTKQFTSIGHITNIYATTCASIEVYNSSTTNTVTVQTGPPSNNSGIGTGTHPVPPGATRVVNVFDRVVTLFGTSGDNVSIQAFTVPALPSINSHPLAVDGGTA